MKKLELLSTVPGETSRPLAVEGCTSDELSDVLEDYRVPTELLNLHGWDSSLKNTVGFVLGSRAQHFEDNQLGLVDTPNTRLYLEHVLVRYDRQAAADAHSLLTRKMLESNRIRAVGTVGLELQAGSQWLNGYRPPDAKGAKISLDKPQQQVLNWLHEFN